MMKVTYNYSGLNGLWPSSIDTGNLAITVSYDALSDDALSYDQDIRPNIQWQNRSEVNHAELPMKESQYSDAWIRLLRDDLFSIQGIESMYLARDETNVDVWVVIPKRDIDLVRKIAETEREIMSQFFNHQRDPIFYFDFHTVYMESSRVEELVPRSAIEIPRS